jgi:glutamate/tyrosine decarboxylase-like PLP-dependent enzyme
MQPFPEDGVPVGQILSRAADLLFEHSLLNGHPKFHGYITSSAAPIGALADLLAAAINPNSGANILSPMATEIEKQTIKWLAEFIGVSPSYGGLLVSGGNMANFTAFLAARTVKAPKTIKQEGISSTMKLAVYCPATTHTWIEKAATLFGLGLNSIRWIKTDRTNRMDNELLEETIISDLKNGFKPIMVVGTAGDVSTGQVDDLKGVAKICRQYDLWFHIDGAYGAPAAIVPELKNLFEGIAEADSIALDPHKWLYAPLEAGCTLVKNPNHLIETYSSHPVYYNFSADDAPDTLNYYEYGFQNSRGFRALKVWAALQQMGRSGYIQSISEDIRLSKLLFQLADEHDELEAVTQNLSIATFRFVPQRVNDAQITDEILNKLNQSLVNNLQKQGRVFLSNAVIGDKYCLRSCIVNFRTTEKDIHEIIEIVVAEGRGICKDIEHVSFRPAGGEGN